MGSDAISDGAIAKPATNKATVPISQTAPDQGERGHAEGQRGGADLEPVDGPFVQWIAPVITPASRLPSAQRASRTPVTPGTPCSSANATVVTSADPNNDPSASATTASGRTIRHGIPGACELAVDHGHPGVRGWLRGAPTR